MTLIIFGSRNLYKGGNILGLRGELFVQQRFLNCLRQIELLFLRNPGNFSGRFFT